MTDLESGMLVEHASLGVGKVVALEPKAVHVFFAKSDARFATKLRLPMSLPLLGPAASGNAWLTGLPDFALDAKTGRYGLAGTWLSHADAVARFLEASPGGFAEPGRVAEGAERRERGFRWRRAHDVYVESLGGGEGEKLLAAGDIAGLVARALEIERHVRALHKDADKASFEEALKDLDGARGYFAALFDLLATPAPEQARFEALAAAVAAMAPALSSEARWPLVTLLPFVARPELHMLLRPRFACESAQRLGLELAYEPQPSWTTYSSLLRSAAVLLEKLRPIGARDYVDVDVFMHAVTTKPRPKPQLRLVT